MHGALVVEQRRRASTMGRREQDTHYG